MNQKKTVPISAELLESAADIYIRVSTTEQAQEGYSVEEQERRLQQYCKAMDIKIHQIYVDAAYSGSSLERPGIQEVIRDVRAHKVKKVIVWKLDRLSRSQKDTLIMLEDVFLENNCDFVSMLESFDTSTPFGRAIVGILAAFAQLERENIKERTSMGRIARIAKGHYSASHPPLGYHFIPGSNDLAIEEYESNIVQEIYTRFLSGESLNGIAESMKNKYGENLRTWNNTFIRRILVNPVYMGKVRQNDKLYDGIHEPIISETEYYMVAALLEHNRQINKQSRRSESLLTGLLYCGDCGARMQPRRVASGYKLHRYICYSVSRTNKAMIRSNNCTNRLHPFTLEQLDNMIIEEVLRLAVDKEYLQSILEKDTAPKVDETELFRERLVEVKKQMDKLLNLYQIGAVDISDIADRLESLKEEKEALQHNIDRSAAETPLPIEKIQSYVQLFKEALESGDNDTARQIIRMLIDKIVVLNEDIEIHWSF